MKYPVIALDDCLVDAFCYLQDAEETINELFNGEEVVEPYKTWLDTIKNLQKGIDSIVDDKTYEKILKEESEQYDQYDEEW